MAYSVHEGTDHKDPGYHSVSDVSHLPDQGLQVETEEVFLGKQGGRSH